MTIVITSALWNDIEDFEFGLSEASLTFADRLARENGWDVGFAGRVIDEYRRFCFLAMTAGHPVTPSEQVDQAWHLHLLYTENYWTEFCGEVLGRPFHHGPTRGGSREGSKFNDWYQMTLDSYRRVFGEAPPADIWPDAQARFRDAHLFRRVNTSSHWVIPRPDGASLRRWLLPAAVIPALGACAISSDGRSTLLAIIVGIIALLVVFGIVADRTEFYRMRREARSKGARGIGGRKRDGKKPDGRNTGAGGCGGAVGCGHSGCGSGCGGGG